MGNAVAIEASTDQFSIVASWNGRVACHETRPAREQSARIYLLCQELLASLGGEIEGLDFVAFGCGPGSFTGVRIAAAAAQALALARRLPVCRVSSLRVLALGACRTLGVEVVGVSLDARMQRAYIGCYASSALHGVVAQAADLLVDPGSFVIPGHGAFVAVGDGWQSYPQMLARHRSRVIAMEPDLLPSARELMELAQAEFAAGRTVSAAQALPEYLGHEPAYRM